MRRVVSQDQLHEIDIAAYKSFVLVACGAIKDGDEIVSGASLTQALHAGVAAPAVDHRLYIEVADPFDPGTVERVRSFIENRLLSS